MENKNNVPTEELTQYIEETGPDLKKLRESRGMTLKEVFKLTRIRVSILQAIENEDFHLLPEPVYARTFIKTYIKMLGIDGEKILSRYEEYLEQNEAPDEKETTGRNSWFRSHRSLLVWIFSVLAVAVFLGFFFYPNHKAKQEIAGKPTGESKLVKDAKEKTADKINSKTETHATADKTASKQEDLAEEKPGATQDIANYKLTIEATEVTWLKIAEGDNPPEEILLNPGEKIQKEASDGFNIYIGNAGGVNVLFQGKPLGVLGEHGQVVHLKLPEDIESGR